MRQAMQGSYIVHLKFGRFFGISMVALALACPAAQAAAAARPYELEGTEVQSIPSRILHRDYEIFVSLPAS